MFPIHHTFGPLATSEQCALASQLRRQPWRWRHGPERDQLRAVLSTRFGRSASLFHTGREALFAILKALNVQQGEEVVVQGYTCVVVANAIHAAGGVAVFADIDIRTLNLDVDVIQRSITSRTRAIICQHTFGIPADTPRLRALCDKRGLVLIEDCAHFIPEDTTANDQLPYPVGELGDVVLLSFGRDKALSGVSGGAALTQHPAIATALSQIEQQSSYPSFFHVFQLLSYPLHYAFAKRHWGTYTGRLYLRLLRSLRLLPMVVSEEERRGGMQLDIQTLPNACAVLALQQWQSLPEMNAHRRMRTSQYLDRARASGWHVPQAIVEGMALQKLPLYVESSDALRAQLKQEQVHLEDGWSGAVVNPRSADQELAGYALGACPTAEQVAKHIVSLPTHPTMSAEQVRYVLTALGSHVGIS